MAALDDLIAIATLEAVGDDRFVGVGSRDDGFDATYGGHFLGQAVAAASATVDHDQRIHSLHAYFLRAGRPGQPFTLAVDRLRDGRTFSSRRVTVYQDDTKPQFELLASFARPEDGPQLQASAPVDLTSLPRPDDLPRRDELMQSLDPLPLPEAWALRDYGLDLRTIAAPWAPDGPSAEGGIRIWARADGELPDEPALHCALLAYQSDESLADNIAIPWGATWGSPGVIFVSLDHAMWFHRPFDLNRWHLIDQQPLTVSQGRGVATATVWSPEGELVASFTQEALLRFEDNRLVENRG
ncbi:MAG: acyl-CoA thioesterase II [Actinomycetia bacterium]|nr:acyl-CoA thioesterase II [Actinomycetes bacterium]MCP5035772.1 acyl-CoA thioesterase II [Actinomycetes bacterium]